MRTNIDIDDEVMTRAGNGAITDGTLLPPYRDLAGWVAALAQVTAVQPVAGAAREPVSTQSGLSTSHAGSPALAESGMAASDDVYAGADVQAHRVEWQFATSAVCRWPSVAGDGSRRPSSGRGFYFGVVV